MIDDDGVLVQEPPEVPVPIRVTQGWLVPTVAVVVQEQEPDFVSQESLNGSS